MLIEPDSGNAGEGRNVSWGFGFGQKPLLFISMTNLIVCPLTVRSDQNYFILLVFFYQPDIPPDR